MAAVGGGAPLNLVPLGGTKSWHLAVVVNACNYTGAGVIGYEAITWQRTLAAPRCRRSVAATALLAQIGARIHALVASNAFPPPASLGLSARRRAIALTRHHLDIRLFLRLA